MTALKAELFHYRLPFVHSVLGMSHRDGLILQLTREGRVGYGDIAPLPSFSAESFVKARAEVHKWCRRINDGTHSFELLIDEVDDASPQFPYTDKLSSSVVFGIESALWWLHNDQWLAPQPLQPLLNEPTDTVVAQLRAWRGRWPQEMKLKIGHDDLSVQALRIRRVMSVLPQSVKLKLDFNRRWHFDDVCRLSERFDVTRISYVEEPTANPEQFENIYDRTGLHYALDETIQSSNYEFVPQRGLAAIVLKPTLVGGLRRAREMIDAAQQHDVRAVLSSSYESSVGLKVLQQLSAAWTPAESPGIDTARAFAQTLIDDGLWSHIEPGSVLPIDPQFLVEE